VSQLISLGRRQVLLLFEATFKLVDLNLTSFQSCHTLIHHHHHHFPCSRAERSMNALRFDGVVVVVVVVAAVLLLL